ncbi:MAG TPA: hypothetical protein VGS07_18520 [Thermoanaerobaculia bacterium]|nr:hypothetical protein [Thermoanaerobaculia bacterium]
MRRLRSSFVVLLPLLFSLSAPVAAAPAAPRPAKTRLAAPRLGALPQFKLEKVAGEPTCPNNGPLVTAYVVAIDQQLMLNRLGANLPSGQIFALARDVFPKDSIDESETNSCRARWNTTTQCKAGNVRLRSEKRPRPLVVRVNEGGCMQLIFANLLTPSNTTKTLPQASIHVQGAEWLQNSSDDGSWVGHNDDSLVKPDGVHTYTLYAAHEGPYVLYNTADTFSKLSVNDGGQIALGLFGAINIQPAGAEWYRSQVTEQELCRASTDSDPAATICRRSHPNELPNINYRAAYKTAQLKGVPVLNMLGCPNQEKEGCPHGGELEYSDLTAIITGRAANGQPGRFPDADSQLPVFNPAYALPDRLQPWREFTVIYHEMFGATQAFPNVYKDVVNGNGTGADNFGINYGMAGIGGEILANRFGVGPMAECTSCKYEEFFLASWAVGDPAMVVDKAAYNSTNCVWNATTLTYKCSQTPDNTATVAKYPDDPSNVYHSYMLDHTKFQIHHAGVDLHHMHHQHAHQWMHTTDTPNGDYTDSQTIGPGSSFTLEMVYNGSGNLNQTVGDSIFHCHFYPHFAAGMWGLWRVHDVFEAGTELDDAGRPRTGAIPSLGKVTTARALPDGEIAAGTPIPGLVPLPTLAMAPLPAKTLLTKNGTEILVCRTLPNGTTECKPNLLAGDPDGDWKNPGFPFFIPGIGGQRSSHPPMDFAYACSDNGQACAPKYGATPADLSLCASPQALCQPLDGGLPRHLILAGGETDVPPLNPQDFSKTLESVAAQQLPEEGTLIEKVAMKAHAQRFHATKTPEGASARFILNGLPAVQGAPYADPCINYSTAGGVPPNLKTRRYRAADIQIDAVFNKEGWHHPQERLLTLWGDVKDTLNGTRPPQPFFFRANSGECIEYTHANLVPNVYELDDFEVRTPTDILGQHIHLVKFDVTSSDGATNGFNYEDGTFAPNEVTERILAIRAHNGCKSPDPRDGTFACPVARMLPFFGPGPGGQWVGAQATIQRWYADPLFDGPQHDPPARGARDRTLRTVFTHDHFGPSTHQQAGLYAGLVIEPTGSNWYSNEIGPGVPDQIGGVDRNGTPLILRTPKGYDGKPLPDGGPTSWQAVISTVRPEESFREFVLELQDSTLGYNAFAGVQVPAALSKGFCADSPATSCTPATTANYDQPTGCRTGACISYGFCSNNLQASCIPAPWATPTQINTACGSAATVASCNLIPGTPGVCNGCASVPANPPALAVSNPALWKTTPLDSSAGPEIITFSNATNNFSTNYRNEPLTGRLNSKSTNPLAGDYSYAYVSLDRGSLRGVCSSNGNISCTDDAGCTSGNGTCVLGGFCADSNAFCTPLGSKCASGAACNPTPYPSLTAQPAQPGDPFTPILRAYAGDDVEVRALVGAHTNPHNLTLMGLKWLFEPSMPDSGWRNSMVMGISEHTEQIVRLPTYVSAKTPDTPFADYVYMSGAAANEQEGGNWGLLRAYGLPQASLRPLPQNRVPSGSDLAVCPQLTPPHKLRTYTVVATTAVQALGGALIYNKIEGLDDPNGILFYNLDDLSCPGSTPSASCTAKSKTPQPLVMRASAGDCLQVKLYNVIDPANLAAGTSAEVGLHPQLVSFDESQSSGFNSGFNPIQTVAAPSSSGAVSSNTYTWYAGNIDAKAKPANYIPIEFGAANLMSSDIANHYAHGLFGALVIEPEGAEWPAAESTSITTVVSAPGQHGLPPQRFREFVLTTRDVLNLQQETNVANYGSEPLYNPTWKNNVRYCDSKCSSTTDVSCVLAAAQSYCCTAFDTTSKTCTSCSACSTNTPAPATPTFSACAGEQVRFRVLDAGGTTNTNQVFELYGHIWAETPYISFGRGCIPATTQSNLYASSIIGNGHLCTLQQPTAEKLEVPKAELESLHIEALEAPLVALFSPLSRFALTDWQGSRMGHGPTNHYDVLIASAGGINARPGDYLYRTYPAMHFRLGLWGVFSVLSPAQAKTAGLQCIGK